MSENPAARKAINISTLIVLLVFTAALALILLFVAVGMDALPAKDDGGPHLRLFFLIGSWALCGTVAVGGWSMLSIFSEENRHKDGWMQPITNGPALQVVKAIPVFISPVAPVLMLWWSISGFITRLDIVSDLIVLALTGGYVWGGIALVNRMGRPKLPKLRRLATRQ